MELFVRDALTKGRSTGIAVGSAGTQALSGHRIDPTVGAAARALGLDTGSFRAHQLTRVHVLAAELILTADRSHRSAVVRLVPTAHRRVFTLRQAVRLLRPVLTTGSTPDGDPGLAGLADTLARLRGRHPASAADDVPDPYRGSPATYAHSIGLMQPALTELCRVIESRLD